MLITRLPPASIFQNIWTGSYTLISSYFTMTTMHTSQYKYYCYTEAQLWQSLEVQMEGGKKEGRKTRIRLQYYNTLLLNWSPDHSGPNPSKKYYMRLLYVLSNKDIKLATHIYTVTKHKWLWVWVFALKSTKTILLHIKNTVKLFPCW